MSEKRNDELFFKTFGDNPLKDLYPTINTSVSVEELAQEIAFSYDGCSILKDSFYLNTAKHLLTKFKMERKG